MKRRDLLNRLHAAAQGKGLALVSLRNSGGHEVFSLGGLRIVVPNHREVAEGTAQSIMRQASEKLGPEWWK